MSDGERLSPVKVQGSVTFLGVWWSGVNRDVPSNVKGQLLHFGSPAIKRAVLQAVGASASIQRSVLGARLPVAEIWTQEREWA